LTYAGLDTPQLTEDDPARSDPVGHPIALAFEGIEHGIESFPEASEDVIVVEAHSMTGVKRGRRPTDQDGIGHKTL
jgi:hypothetical protein